IYSSLSRAVALVFFFFSAGLAPACCRKVFDSPQEGFEFFNMYSWELGFGIRYGSSCSSLSGRRTRQDIVCACKGRDPSCVARSTRCGCLCMIRMLRKDDDSWFISRFVPGHNHPMNLRANNVQISRVCSILGSMHGSNQYVPFSRQSIRSLCGRLAQESIEGDMTKRDADPAMRDADPAMVLRMQLDQDKRVKSLFWYHGSSRFNYSCFGDAITFDTTYRTNLYNLPFVLFVDDANHHFQSVIFGTVLLLTEETSDAFQWSFCTFVEAMDGCKWHVLKKAKESLGDIYSKNFAFKRSLHELLDEIVSIPEFETRWADLVDKYGLVENEFLGRAYQNRHMWAKPYFAETFCVGMTSTQCSESPFTHTQDLYSKYNRMIADRDADEGKEEHAKQVMIPLLSRRFLRVGVPIEAHAAQVYTRAMYERFSKELFKAGKFGCMKDGDEGY
uniref:Protein FAR1-RELATED SEQUENCE n=1 Tax=Setaria italica TaxID=4555 RepID=K4A135_SETIT